MERAVIRRNRPMSERRQDVLLPAGISIWIAVLGLPWLALFYAALMSIVLCNWKTPAPTRRGD